MKTKSYWRYKRMEIQIGEYVRTKKGVIAKVCAYQDLTTYDDKNISATFHSFDTEKGSIADVEIEKHSFNITDLIEERRLCEW